MKYLHLLFFVFLFSCIEQNEETSFNKLSSEDHAKFNKEFEAIRGDILDTRALTFALKESGYTYNVELLNDIKNAKEYLNSKEMSLNIGVYASDLNYMTVFENENLSLTYVNSILKLAEELDIAEAFDRTYLFEILNNDIPNYRIKSDELNDVFEQAKSEINSRERAQISALILAGGWVEGMYISTSLASENWPNDSIAQDMWEQCLSYHKVMNMMEIFKEYPPCDAVYLKFKELEPSVRIISDGNVESMKKHLNSFHGIITDLRSFVIEN